MTSADNSPETAAGESLSRDTTRGIVGIGASAGGIDALQKFFPAVAAGAEQSFIVVQHLAPDRASTLTDVLSRVCRLPVTLVEAGMAVDPGTVYVIPPNAILTIDGGRLHLATPAAARDHRTPIDSFLLSLAGDQEENAACIILSAPAATARWACVPSRRTAG